MKVKTTVKESKSEVKQIKSNMLTQEEQKKSNDMAKFIKRINDERVACQVQIIIKSIRIEAQSDILNASIATPMAAGNVSPQKKQLSTKGLYALQILRGPLLSETKEIRLP